MGGADVGAAVGGAANHDGAVDEAPAHVTHKPGVVHDLIPGDRGEAPEHELHHRTQPQHRGAHAHADESRLADGRVHHAFVPETFPETLGDFVGTVVFGHFFAEQHHVFVAFDFFSERVTQRFAVGDFWHC